MHQRGAALLVALAALALMSVFAVTIVTVVRVERKASAAYVDDVRAALVAQAGVERALWKLSDSFREPLTSDPYPWAYLDVSGRDASGLPLEGASRVSLQTGLLELESNGRLPFSGCLGGTYQQGGDVYALKILDASSQIDLNDEWPGLASALDVLGVAIGELRGRDPVRKRGAAIVALRDQERRITSKLELAAVLGDDDARLLSDFVTVDGWPDPAARRPIPVQRGGPNAGGLPSFVPERRCPVNLNGASRPVLVALVAGIASTASEPIDATAAGKIADAIVARRSSQDPLEGPFRDAVALDEFVIGLATGPRPVLSPEQAEALVANLDPNARVQELNPETTARPPYSKADLTARTTEATFFPHGTFEVQSLGLIVAQGRIVASAARRATVRAYQVVRHTTQLDFETAALSATTNNCAVFPNSTRRLGGLASSTDSGYVQLCDPEAQCGDELLMGRRLLEAPYTDTLAAEVGYAAQGTRREDLASTLGGDLDPDGTRTGALHRPLFYEVALPAREGAIDLWVKMDRDTGGTSGSIVQATTVLAKDVVIVTDLVGSSDGRTLTLELRRKLYWKGPSVVLPYPTSETRTAVSLPDLGTFGEWHHLRIGWTAGLDSFLAVDGMVQPTTLKKAVLATDPTAWPPPVPLPCKNELVIGGHDTPDGPLWRRMTVDDVVVHEAGVPKTVDFSPPERYPAQTPDYVGRFVGHFGPFDEDVEFGSIYWTERRPKKWGTVAFTPDDFALQIVVVANGTTLSFQLPPTGVTLLKQILPLAPAPAPSPSGPWLRPELQMVPGSPAEPLGSDQKTVVYEVRFRYRHEGLLGLFVPPLNASPVLDDVTLVYRSRPTVVRTENDF